MAKPKEREPITAAQHRLQEQLRDGRRREAEFEATWDPRERGEATGIQPSIASRT